MLSFLGMEGNGNSPSPLLHHHLLLQSCHFAPYLSTTLLSTTATTMMFFTTCPSNSAILLFNINNNIKSNNNDHLVHHLLLQLGHLALLNLFLVLQPLLRVLQLLLGLLQVSLQSNGKDKMNNDKTMSILWDTQKYQSCSFLAMVQKWKSHLKEKLQIEIFSRIRKQGLPASFHILLSTRRSLQPG